MHEPAPGRTLYAPPQPRVVSVAQRPGTALLDIDYEIIDADSPLVEVRVLAWLNGGSGLNDLVIPTSWVEGTAANKGPGTPANAVHRLTWDVAADFSEPFGYFEIEILARDDQPPLPVHWIGIPEGEDLDAFEISKTPATSDQTLQLLRWELVAEDSDFRLLLSPTAVQRISDGAILFLGNSLQLSSAVNDLLNVYGMSFATNAGREHVDSGRFGQQGTGSLSLVRGARVDDAPPLTLMDEMVFIEGGVLTASSPFAAASFLLGKYSVTYAHWQVVR